MSKPNSVFRSSSLDPLVYGLVTTPVAKSNASKELDTLKIESGLGVSFRFNNDFFLTPSLGMSINKRPDAVLRTTLSYFHPDSLSLFSVGALSKTNSENAEISFGGFMSYANLLGTLGTQIYAGLESTIQGDLSLHIGLGLAFDPTYINFSDLKKIF